MNKLNSMLYKEDGPVTNGVIIICTIIYLLFASDTLKMDRTYCYRSGEKDLNYYLKRFATTFIHLGVQHLLVNMIAMQNMREYESKMGSGKYAFLILVFAIVSTLISETVYTIIGVKERCAIGFSGVLFALMAYDYQYGNRASFMGKDMDYLATVALNIILIQVSVPNISFVGHVSGFITGVLALLVV